MKLSAVVVEWHLFASLLLRQVVVRRIEKLVLSQANPIYLSNLWKKKTFWKLESQAYLQVFLV
jgi:hypothetical protein